MLFIPLTGKISWKNPPVLTLVLITANLAVFIALQSGESKALARAQKAYIETRLAEIEITSYIKYLNESKSTASIPQSVEELDEIEQMRLLAQMMRDNEFQLKLSAGEIITPAEKEYPEWRGLRTVYEEELARLPSMRYGLRPAEHRPVTFASYMFLHGGIGHLIGNMIFLWVFGCVIEMSSGRIRYAAVYLLSGLAAGALFWGVYPRSLIPLVGASGAIAGLMGALATLFGRRKIRFFAYFGFYFANFNIPAIYLLPVWIGNEIYQLAFGGLSNVAYVAHIGGLVAGAALALADRRLAGRDQLPAGPEPAGDQQSCLLEQALKHMAELDHPKAQALLEQVLIKSPEDTRALTHLFHITKLDPESPKFHQTAARLLAVLSADRSAGAAGAAVFKEYLRCSPKPRLSPALYLSLGTMLAANGEHEQGAKIVTALMRKMPDLPGIPAALWKLSESFKAKGMGAQRQRCLEALNARYPHSTEAAAARQCVRNSPGN